MRETIIAKYGEIILKGGNRPRFERMLADNIKYALKNITDCRITIKQATIYVEDFDEDKTDLIVERMSLIFGIVAITKAAVCEKDFDTIVATAKEYLYEDLSVEARFKVAAKRADKSFPMTSTELSIALGGELDDAFEGIKCDVHDPEITVKCEIREAGAYIYIMEKMTPGQGGMPTGSGLKATLLLSGGIDSPVAGHMIAKRGVTIDAVNFFSFPYTSERAKEKVIELAGIIARYTSKIKLYIVPFTEIQLAIRDKCPEEYMTLIMRRFMMRISERIARDHGSKALITGESVGQVASQTLSALDVTNAVVDMPVLQPLIGMDKLEVIQRAEKIGTYETSILPYEDCCTVFTPKHPKVNPKRANVERAEAALDVAALEAEALANIELIEVYPE